MIYLYVLSLIVFVGAYIYFFNKSLQNTVEKVSKQIESEDSNK